MLCEQVKKGVRMQKITVISIIVQIWITLQFAACGKCAGDIENIMKFLLSLKNDDKVSSSC